MFLHCSMDKIKHTNGHCRHRGNQCTFSTELTRWHYLHAQITVSSMTFTPGGHFWGWFGSPMKQWHFS